MKPKWAQQRIDREETVNAFSPILSPEKEAAGFSLECLYDASHAATILHKGTAYCRPCYDEKNRLGLLIN